MSGLLGSKISGYRELLARRRLSSLWQAERKGAGVKSAEGGEATCLADLQSACERLGLPCAGEGVNVDGLSDLELALVCDCFGDDAFGADPTPRLASFRYMRRFLFGRMRNRFPKAGGGADLQRFDFDKERREVLEQDDVAAFGMGRELMGEEFTERELDFLLQKGSVGILRMLCEDGTLEDPRYARRLADAFWGDVASPRNFDVVRFIKDEHAAGSGVAWRSSLTVGFKCNGATAGNPLVWGWDAAQFCCRDGYRCAGIEADGQRDPSLMEKLASVGFGEGFVDDEGISREECQKAYHAYRELCESLFGLSRESVSGESVFRSRYLVIDLSSGCASSHYPVEGLDAEPTGGWTEEYKTTKLVLRRIEPGTFTMGSPSKEVGRLGEEVQREITLTRPFYFGIFELTQRQWELVMGRKPSQRPGARHPVENVSYDDIRGGVLGDAWPVADTVDGDSFMGRLRARTGLDALDLPTEAEWEYAARAGVRTSLTSGKDMHGVRVDDGLAEVGRYGGNRGTETHAEVGSYKPNAWGIYDVQGNVFEWCLDRYGGVSGTAETDPRGPEAGDLRVQRSGAWMFTANSCRLANRVGKGKSKSNGTMGLRVACR